VLGAAHIDKNLREVKDICQYFLGIDPAKDYIPVRPTQHYSMGGVRTDHRGESPWLKGLFSCGEAACWDMHGFNRLGGNSVAETVVAGMLVGEYVADFCQSSQGDIRLLHRPGAGVPGSGTGRSRRPSPPAGATRTPVAIRRRMEAIMTDSVGLFRNGPALEAAVVELTDLLRRSQRLGMRSRRLDANPELVQAYRLPRMLKVALTVALGALNRTESRGAHYREDLHGARRPRLAETHPGALGGRGRSAGAEL
jgi:fumarate reductase flavoprotein subunit